MQRRTSFDSEPIPLDLLIVGAVTIGALISSVVVGFTDSTIRVVLGLVFVLFAPGYAVVSLLVPATDLETGSRVTVTERVVLSIGLSVIVVPLVGIVLSYTRWGLQPAAVLGAVGVLTLLLLLLAGIRRYRVAPSRRYGRTGAGVVGRFHDLIVVPRNRRETVLNAVIVAGLVVAVLGVGLALATTDSGERYTEFYLLSEDPETGELVADELPTELTVGESAELHVGIGNNEQTGMEYTVVTQLQRVDGSVTDRTELDRFELTLEDGETREQPHVIEPTMEGELRVAYLLYVDDPPEEPTEDDAYRSVHFWIDVE